VLGASLLGESVAFTVWAPRCRSVELVLEGVRPQPLTAREPGLFRVTVARLPEGTRYRYRLDGARHRPDPASRWQPEGVHGPSVVVDPRRFVWTDQEFRGRDFADLVFARLAEAIEALDGPDGALLAELDRGRTGAMADIVATIQAAQYRLMRFPLEHVLVIEGGPGTGKTAVALHRVSWLLFNEQDRLAASDVLVVGPHPAFTRYIRTVLPDLGERYLSTALYPQE